MINYAPIIKQKEKDNPSPFLRASYLFSNVGDLVKCYGRSLRFPQDKKLYEAEMKLALADVIMQTEMKQEDIKSIWYITTKTIHMNHITKITSLLTLIAQCTTSLMENNESCIGEIIDTEIILGASRELCKKMNWDYEDIRHLGFLHVMERYEQFEREGWK